MYFPYFRGRQFELIALRELLEKGLLSKKIVPIIEPIKMSSTLTKTLKMYNDKERNISLILNPIEGPMKDTKIYDENGNSCHDITELCKSKNIIPAFHLRKNLVKIKENNDISDTILVANNEDTLCLYDEIFNDISPRYSLIKDESGFRRKIRVNRVMFADRFKKKNRNADYCSVPEEFFSDDHIYYNDDGYIGFADYSVVGDEYSDSGFAPYAVAIHIVYFDEKNTLRINHFVSNSNDDYSNTTGKFYEALKKLVEWNEKAKLNTYAIKQFEDMYHNPKYPGLGTVKKLTIMHHLELISNYLETEN